MPLNKTVKRELEIAFSKKSQSISFRVVKYVIIGVLIYLLWGTPWLWIVFSILLVLSLAMHLWYRYKTKAWTQSYGGWEYFESKHGKD